MDKATILHVGNFRENYEGSGKPLVDGWITEGGDYPGVDGRAVTDDEPVLGGWSANELRQMAKDAGTHFDGDGGG